MNESAETNLLSYPCQRRPSGNRRLGNLTRSWRAPSRLFVDTESNSALIVNDNRRDRFDFEGVEERVHYDRISSSQAKRYSVERTRSALLPFLGREITSISCQAHHLFSEAN